MTELGTIVAELRTCSKNTERCLCFSVDYGIVKFSLECLVFR